ncbi:hypothetical protein JCM11641_006518 [Rhodosporidiobolus odoratus]
MPLSPPSSLLSPLVHTRRKQVTFSPLLPHLEQQHVNPDFDTPQQQYRHQPATLERAQLPAATFHRFRRLDELLEPSPAVRFPRSKALQKDSSPLRAGLTDSTSLATPPLSRKTPPSLADKRQSPTSHQGQEKKDGATQTSPSLARHPGSALRNAIIPDSRTLDREPRQGFVAQPRRSTESISPSQSSASARSRLSYLASPAATHTEDSNSRPPPPKAPFHGGSKDQRSRSPPLSPPFQAQAKPSIPPQPLYAAPPPRSLAHTSPTTYSSPLSTIGLAPFRLALSSSAAQKAKTASKERSANRQAWVQLLPTALRLQDRPSLARRGGGEVGGDVLLDSRDRDGRVWVIRGDGSSVTLFHPPPSAPPSPLILLHPIATFNQRQLLTLKKAEARTDGAGEDLLSSARKAYKAIEKVLHIVRTRTALMSFFPSFPHATLPSNSPSSAFPSADSSFYSSDSRMKAKCTLFSDLPPSAVSFSVTFSLLLTPASPGGGSGASAHTPSSQQESVAVGIFISPMRDMVIVSLTFPHRASSISTSPSETPRPLRSSYTDPPVPLSNMSRSRTERFSARGLSRLSSSLSSSASTGGRNLTAFLESHLSPTSTLVVHSAVGYALSAEYRAAVEKVRKGYLDATAPLPPPPRPPRPPAPSSPLQPKTDTPMLSGQAATVEAEEGGWESPETLLVKLFSNRRAKFNAITTRGGGGGGFDEDEEEVFTRFGVDYPSTSFFSTSTSACIRR